MQQEHTDRIPPTGDSDTRRASGAAKGARHVRSARKTDSYPSGFAALAAANSRTVSLPSASDSWRNHISAVSPSAVSTGAETSSSSGRPLRSANPDSPDPAQWVDMSSRLLGAEITDDPSDALRPILQQVHAHHPDSDLSILRRAYNRAVWQHRDERRRSGEQYIIHPLGVAQILADLGMTPRVVAAGLLHDTVEDTDYTLEQCREEFGDTVAGLVDGVTKISKIEYGDSAQAETIRKLVVAMSKDVRTLVVKLADRVHNARTWRYVPARSANHKARETLDIYAPLANRLGMNAIKTELEELSFKQLYPKIYNEIVVLVARRTGKRDVYLRQVLDEIRTSLRSAKIDAYVTGRPKSYFSIYQKMVVRGHDFEHIYDLLGVRIIVNSIRDCYAALGMVHANWKPIPGRFKDYIAMPKLNMYQSLHTTVVGPGGKPVEIQIRTWEMHRRAEFGIAAHWKYKENGTAGRALSAPDASDKSREITEERQEAEQTLTAGASTPGATSKEPVPVSGSGRAPADEERELSEEENLRWIQQLADWTSETPDSNEFLGSLKEDLGAGEVYVFTPRGKVITLPAGATPVDFAYAIHTEVGHHTMGARVNSKLVPLDTRLTNGDSVEIITSKAQDAGPSRDWLSFVKSPKARNKIKQWFGKERRTEAIEDGRDELTRALRRRNLPINQFMSEPAMVGLAQDLGLGTPNAVFSAIGEGKVSTQNAITHLIHDQNPQEVDEDLEEAALPLADLSRKEPGIGSGQSVIVEGSSDVWTKLAKCCTPVPGDPIVGFITKTQGVSVHRADCINMLNLEKQSPQRVVPVRWANNRGTFLVRIQIEALDRPHLLGDIIRTLSDAGVDIASESMQVGRNRVAIGQFEFQFASQQHLRQILAEIRKLDGVYDAYRLTGSYEMSEILSARRDSNDQARHPQGITPLTGSPTRANPASGQSDARKSDGQRTMRAGSQDRATDRKGGRQRRGGKGGTSRTGR